MNTADLLQNATGIALMLLLVALVLCVIRIARGPTLPDRILGLDTLTTVIIGFIATFAVRTASMLYLDIAISLGLVGFLATVALARYVLSRGEPAKTPRAQEGPR